MLRSNGSFVNTHTSSSNPCGSGLSRIGEAASGDVSSERDAELQTLSTVSYMESFSVFAELDDTASQENIRLLCMVRS